MRIIVALSGGMASAWCASWSLRQYPRDTVIWYFNDTKWEHPDLYRFLRDLSIYYDHKITYDSDGRSPEELFHDHHALANNRMPFCSRILKAERLQKYYNDGDIIIFGIGCGEKKRADRIIAIYQQVAAKTGRFPKIIFPLISEKVTKLDIQAYFHSVGIREPELYNLGFCHNNCSGGCVRAGKRHWKLLYEKLPEVYLERERVEREMREETGKDISFLKNETLEHFRWRIENKKLSLLYYKPLKCRDTECVGICNSIS